MKSFTPGDQEIAAIFNLSRIGKPTYCCHSGKKVSLMCLNKCCNQALYCIDEECKNCQEKHLICQSQKAELRHITKRLDNLSDQRSKILKQIQDYDCKIIQQIRSSCKEIVSKIPIYNLKESSQAVIDKIYKEQKGKNITGFEAKNFYDNLAESMVMVNEKMSAYLQTYRHKIQALIEEFKSLKKWLESKFTTTSLQIESKIIKKSQSQDKINFIIQNLSKQSSPPKQIKLIFRASEHSFSGKLFHQKCDNFEDTLILVKTQFGKTIGGYSHYKWKIQEKSWINDSKCQAFLFQLDLKKILRPTKNINLIRLEDTHGPIFGKNMDLAIGDKANLSRNSCAKIMDTYNYDCKIAFKNKEEAYLSFSGASQGIFRILEWEVFHVIWK